METLFIPDIIRIDLTDDLGKPFRHENILLGIQTFANHKNDINLYPFLSDRDGRLTITKEQVNIAHSLACVLFTGVVFSLNCHFKLLPRHLAIWVVFAVFPHILLLYHYTTNKTTANSGFASAGATEPSINDSNTNRP